MKSWTKGLVAFVSLLVLCASVNAQTPTPSPAATLYISQSDNSSVAKYNASTGATINDGFTGVSHPWLSHPYGLALSGNILFVTNLGSNTVGEINANFITGLGYPDHTIWFLKKGVFSSFISLPTEPVQWHIEDHTK